MRVALNEQQKLSDAEILISLDGDGFTRIFDNGDPYALRASYDDGDSYQQFQCVSPDNVNSLDQASTTFLVFLRKSEIWYSQMICVNSNIIILK